MWVRAVVAVFAVALGGCFVERSGLGSTLAMDGGVMDGTAPGDAAGCPSVDLTSDPDNCGFCGLSCLRVPNATSTCVASVCGIDCGAGHADCDGDSTTGCEVLTDRNPANCGAGGMDCATVPAPSNSVSAGCAESRCQFECAPGFGDCDGDLSNGCEIDLTSSRAHCGRCSFACPLAAHSQLVCRDRACGVLCDSPRYLDCNADPVDGCEQDVEDSFSCGACPGTGGALMCIPGSCTCDAGGCGCAGITI